MCTAAFLGSSASYLVRGPELTMVAGLREGLVEGVAAPVEEPAVAPAVTVNGAHFGLISVGLGSCASRVLIVHHLRWSLGRCRPISLRHLL